MPRDGANIYTQPFPDVASDTTIESVVYNGFTSDVANDLNAPRPILAGGTGGTTADAALTNLSAEKSLQVVTNYNSMVWMSGSFYSASSATGAPVAGHAFVGLVYLADSNNIVLEARDQNDTAVPGRKYVREKKAGTWSVWKSDSLTLTGTNEGVSGDTADMFFGLTGTAPSSAFIVNTESDVSGVNALEVSKAGNIIVRDVSGSGQVILNKSSGVTGKTCDVYGQTNGLNRWILSLANSGSEIGSNLGSDLVLSRYNDAGTLLGTPPLSISRATGLGVVSGNPTDSLGIATKQYVDATTISVVRIQTFSVSGTYTPHANMVSCIIECSGGGGGGGGVAGSASNFFLSGGGGASGSYARKLCTAADIGASKTVTIGAGGAGGSAGANTGITGGHTSVGSLCIGAGGTGGVGTNNAGGYHGGAPQFTSIGDFVIHGQDGDKGTFIQGTITNWLNEGGRGGNSHFGRGAVQSSGGFAVSVGGNAASANTGGGGSGGAVGNSANTTPGGAGGSGFVLITEFCHQ